MNEQVDIESLPDAEHLYIIGVLLPPSALAVFGEYLGEHVVHTPFGNVGPLALRGGPDRTPCWVQPYTGSPTRTDPRATIYAAHQLGVTSILNWDRGRALNPLLQLGQSLFVQDYIDGTKHQPITFFADDRQTLLTDLIHIGHEIISPTHSYYDPTLLPILQGAFETLELVLPGLIYLGLDGPRLETPAEARMYRTWGADVIGFNLIPEVFLAKELAIQYTGVVTITSFSSDHPQPSSYHNATTAVTEGLERAAQALAQLASYEGPPGS
ncbi:MAG: hypothetical protein AAF702_43140 [Chloroflexota bacterium]